MLTPLLCDSSLRFTWQNARRTLRSTAHYCRHPLLSCFYTRLDVICLSPPFSSLSVSGRAVGSAKPARLVQAPEDQSSFPRNRATTAPQAHSRGLYSPAGPQVVNLNGSFRAKDQGGVRECLKCQASLRVGINCSGGKGYRSCLFRYRSRNLHHSKT